MKLCTLGNILFRTLEIELICSMIDAKVDNLQIIAGIHGRSPTVPLVKPKWVGYSLPQISC